MAEVYRYLKAANVVVFLAMIAVNALAEILPIGGATTGEISAMYPNLFTPAGFTFSIWTLIYLLLAGFCIYQYTGGERGDRAVQRIGGLFVLSSVLNISWIFAWHYRAVLLSVLIIVGLLVTLAVVNRKLRIGKEREGFAWEAMVRTPFAIYFGWISIAVIANASAYLSSLGWEGGPIPATVWTSLLVAFAAVVALAVLFLRGQYLYALVFVWAFAGIIVERSVAPPAEDGLVIVTAGFGILCILLGIVVLIARGDLKHSQTESPPA